MVLSQSSPGVLGFLKGHRQRGAGKVSPLSLYLRTLGQLIFSIAPTPSVLQGGIFCVALSPDGHLLAGVDEAGLLSVWEVPSGRLRNSWTVQQQPRPTESHDTLTATPQGKEKCECGCNSGPLLCNGSPQCALWTPIVHCEPPLCTVDPNCALWTPIV